MENIGFDNLYFIGTVRSGEEKGGSFERKLIDEFEDKAKGETKLTVNLVVEGNGSKQKIKFTGKKTKKIKRIKYYKENGDVGEVENVKWADRLKYLETATRTFKFKVEGIEEREFLTQYDLTEYVKDNINELLGKRVYINGSVSYTAMNKKVYPIYKAESIYDAKDEAVCKLELSLSLLINKDSVNIDTELLKTLKPKDRKIGINAFVKTLLIKDGVFENKVVPFTFKMDLTEFDFEDEETIELLEVINEMYNTVQVDPTNPQELEEGVYYKITVTANVVNKDGGDTSEEFDENLLTEQAKKLIKFGVLTKEKAIKQYNTSNKIRTKKSYLRDILLTFPDIGGTPVPFGIAPTDILDLEAEVVEKKAETKVKEVKVEVEEEKEEGEVGLTKMEILKLKLSGAKK